MICGMSEYTGRTDENFYGCNVYGEDSICLNSTAMANKITSYSFGDVRCHKVECKNPNLVNINFAYGSVDCSGGTC